MDDPTLTAVPGVRVGQWTQESGTTGVTVAAFDLPARAGAFRAGFAVSSRQLDGIEGPHISGRIHAVCFTGGSAFGLGVADGVVAALEERGIGFATGHGLVPIVPTAVIFDLAVATARPTAAGARAALEAADRSPVREGTVGAGAGATVAKWVGMRLPGGIGSAAVEVGDAWVGALAVVNAAGSIRDPDTGAFLAGEAAAGRVPYSGGPTWSQNTTLVLVVTNLGLTREQCAMVARMGGAGMARAIDPVFSPFDGDLVICASTGEGESASPVDVGRIGAAAADVVGRAIARSVSPAARRRGPALP